MLKQTDFYKVHAKAHHSAATKKEVSPASSLPTIGHNSVSNLKESNSQLEEVPNKERYCSMGSQGQEVIVGNIINHAGNKPHQHGKLFTKTSKIERKSSFKHQPEAEGVKTTNVRQIPNPQFITELNQGFSKSKSQHFGGKETTPIQGLQNTLENSQRMVFNAIRKGPSFAGMSDIATPNGVHDLAKATVQPSHRILTKG